MNEQKRMRLLAKRIGVLVQVLRTIRDEAALSDECGAESIDDQHGPHCIVGMANTALTPVSERYISDCLKTTYGHCSAYQRDNKPCCYCGVVP